MLFNSKGQAVQVGRKATEDELNPLREVLEPACKHSGKLFRLETRAQFKQSTQK